MLYKIAHILRDRYTWIWDVIEKINSFLFRIRYGRTLKGIDDILKKYNGEYVIEQLKEKHLENLVRFFNEQPESAFEFFKPHAFDAKTLDKLRRNKSFLTFVVKDNNRIVGYFFLRCFFIGKCFRGKIVDYRHRNKGIAKMMGLIMYDIAHYLGIPAYSTISPGNVASLKSSSAVTDFEILKRLDNGDYYVKYK